MATCSKVFLRQKQISKGRISLYLDFWPAIRNPRTMKLTRLNFLDSTFMQSRKIACSVLIMMKCSKKQSLFVAADRHR
jgi:hypothetical protein